MKKLVLLFLIGTVKLSAQDTVRIVHKNYITVFDTVKHYPVFVQWIDTKHNIFCKDGVKRGDDFSPDPKLLKHSDLAEDYKGSGFDRGHISPAGDNGCYGKEVMSESFYYTNMAPQYPGLNRGQWKALEDSTRQLAIHHDSVIVQAGCFGVDSKVKKLSIPTHCWKTITVVKTKEHTAYLFPNVPKKGETLHQYKITTDSLRKLTKLKLN
jgi:endonuclease G